MNGDGDCRNGWKLRLTMTMLTVVLSALLTLAATWWTVSSRLAIIETSLVNVKERLLENHAKIERNEKNMDRLIVKESFRPE